MDRLAPRAGRPRLPRLQRVFLEDVRTGRVAGCTSTEVLQEILYRYWGLGRPDLVREVYDLFVEICPTVFEVMLADTDRARDLLLATQGISTRDAVHAAVMLNREVDTIASFDRGFDRIAGIRRYELS